MFDYLVNNGADSDNISIEDQALCTKDNLTYSLPFIEELQKEYARPLRIGGFRIILFARI